MAGPIMSKIFHCFCYFFLVKIAVNTILRSPPSTSFYAGKFLDLSAVPVSQMLKSEEEPPSSAFQRTYSSASEDTMSSSCGSLQLKQSLSGERERLFESTSSFNMSDQSDSETSFRRTPRHSDSGIQFSAGTSHSSSASLGRVPEHVPQGQLLILSPLESSDCNYVLIRGAVSFQSIPVRGLSEVLLIRGSGPIF